jgi:hypothetical protein
MMRDGYRRGLSSGYSFPAGVDEVSALGGNRTPNLLIRSRRQWVLRMLHRCRFAGQGFGGTGRTAADGSRCYMNCYIDADDLPPLGVRSVRVTDTQIGRYAWRADHAASA